MIEIVTVIIRAPGWGVDVNVISVEAQRSDNTQTIIYPPDTGFPKKEAHFSKLKNSPNLHSYNKKGKIIEIIYLKNI